MSKTGRRSTLAREGITPTLQRATPGSKFGNPTGRAQVRKETFSSQKKFIPGGRASVHKTDDATGLLKRRFTRSSLSSPGSVKGGGKSVTKSLGDGWWLLSPETAGEFQRCGLHAVFESSSNHRFVCVWEPRGAPLIESILGSEPNYNLELEAKCMSPSGSCPSSHLRFYVGFAIRSSQDLYSISADMVRREWALDRVVDGVSTRLQTAADPTLKSNCFYNLLLQVRAKSVSLDSNGTAVFTSVKIIDGRREGDSLSGTVGILAQSSRSVMRNWNVTTSSSAQLFLKMGKPRPQRNAPPPTRSSAPQGLGLGPPPPLPPVSSNSDQPTGAQLAAQIFPDDRPVERPPSYHGDEDPEIVSLIEDDIIDRNLGITFDDIAALADAKRLLEEAIVLPILVPEFFIGIREPWRGVLLFGPPGTGKTMLAKAAAGMNGSTFFNCSSSILTSKRHGESEKIVRCLFSMARQFAPSVIFIDEIDAIASTRSASSEHEASRRLKTELFTQMDGVTSDSFNGQVMILATTNCPWDLDQALRRRLEKRIHIPLPDSTSRHEMFLLNLRGMNIPESVSVRVLASSTEGYSGADIQLVCREASMMPMRALIDNKSPEEIQIIRQSGLLESPQVSEDDLIQALQNTRPSVSSSDLAKFHQWDKEFGSC